MGPTTWVGIGSCHDDDADYGGVFMMMMRVWRTVSMMIMIKYGIRQ